MKNDRRTSITRSDKSEEEKKKIELKNVICDVPNEPNNRNFLSQKEKKRREKFFFHHEKKVMDRFMHAEGKVAAR